MKDLREYGLEYEDNTEVTSDDVNAYEDAVIIKNQLLNADIDALLKDYENYDLYELFVYTIIYIVDNEIEFLL